MSLLLSEELAPSPDRALGASRPSGDGENRSDRNSDRNSDPRALSSILDSILDDLDDFAGLDDTMREFEDELRDLGAMETTIAAIAPPSVGAPTVGGERVVADHIAALEKKLETTFDLSGVDEPVRMGDVLTTVPTAPTVPLPSDAIRDDRPADLDTAPACEPVGPMAVESYAALAGGTDDPTELTPDGLVPVVPSPIAAMSPAAAAAKRAGRRRLLLLLVVLSGLIAFVGLGTVATTHLVAAGAAETVVAASTPPAPTTPPTTAEPTTVPTTEAVPETTTSVTEAPTTTAPPTTAAPVTTVATTVPPTHAPTTARPTTTYAAPTTVASYGFLDCVRARESRGDYSAMNPSGAHGAYQMMPTTARETAMRAGRSDLASTPVVNWSKADQDAMAALLYQWQGAAPWGGGCAYPGN